MSNPHAPDGPTISAVLREGLASALAQRVASIVCLVIVAGMCATVVLTSGRTVAAENAVLASIDSAGTRTITVRAETGSGLDSTVLDRLAGVRGIAWTAAFGPAMDTSNSALTEGQRVPLRRAWGPDLHDLTTPSRSPVRDAIWASPTALVALGMPEAAGSVVPRTGGTALPVVGTLRVNQELRALEPLLVAPLTDDQVGDVAVLVVITQTPDDVAPVANLVRSVLDVADPGTATLTTSENLAELHAVVSGQLGRSGRGLVLLVLAASGVLVAAILHGLVLLRRRDYGRRRALGATRNLVVALVLTQTAAPATVGAAVGCSGAALVLLALDSPVPDLGYLLALGLLAVALAVLAAVLPAVSASRRDPLTELRVP